MNKIIIDADPGVDDTFAILLAGMSKDINLCGISVVGGNCGIENGIRNTFKVLDMCDRNDIPVYKGKKYSLKKNKKSVDDIHGQNGFGDYFYEPIKRKCNGNAIMYLINEVNSHPKEIDVVTIGPLTNIANAIIKNKDFAKNIKSLIIMGGAFGKGNITEHAEFNFYFDPYAAKIVFDSEIEEIVMIGLDVTNKIPLKEKYEKYLKNHENPIADILYQITRVGADFDRGCGFDGFILNDPLTIAYLINKNVIKLKRADVNIELDESVIGKSTVIFTEKGKCNVAYDVDAELFYKILFETIFEKKF